MNNMQCSIILANLTTHISYFHIHKLSYAFCFKASPKNTFKNRPSLNDFWVSLTFFSPLNSFLIISFLRYYDYYYFSHDLVSRLRQLYKNGFYCSFGDESTIYLAWPISVQKQNQLQFVYSTYWAHYVYVLSTVCFRK